MKISALKIIQEGSKELKKLDTSVTGKALMEVKTTQLHWYRQQYNAANAEIKELRKDLLEKYPKGKKFDGIDFIVITSEDKEVYDTNYMAALIADKLGSKALKKCKIKKSGAIQIKTSLL